MIPDAESPGNAFRQALATAGADKRTDLLKKPVCNVVILVHGHNEEEKDGYLNSLIGSPWEFNYKRLVWELLYKEFANDTEDPSMPQYFSDCTIFYEYIYPTYRPIFSPVTDRTGYNHQTLGEDMGRLINEEFLVLNPQLKAMINNNMDFNLFVVAHSQGGLVSRAGLRFIDNRILKHLKQFISWGSPHIGGGLGELLRENTTTLSEFPHTELPNGKMFFSENLNLFNQSEGEWIGDMLRDKYLLYVGTTPKEATIELRFNLRSIYRNYRFAKHTSEVEKGAFLNKLTMKPAFTANDGAVPVYSQSATGLWPEGNIRRKHYDDMDHEEFYGAEHPHRNETSIAKGITVAQDTYNDLGLSSTSPNRATRTCPGLVSIESEQEGNNLIITGKLDYTLYQPAHGGDGKPGTRVKRFEMREKDAKGHRLNAFSFTHQDDGSFRAVAQKDLVPATDIAIVAVMKDNSEVSAQVPGLGAKEIEIIFTEDYGLLTDYEGETYRDTTQLFTFKINLSISTQADLSYNINEEKFEMWITAPWDKDIVIDGVMLFTMLCQAQTTEYNYATGNVEGRNHVGGLIGGSMPGETTVSKSYARGNVIGNEYAGGIIGSNAVTISHTYSTGSVSGSDQAGGLAGLNTGTITSSYWNMQTSGQATSAGGTGQNTAAMTHPYGANAFVGWDFTGIWAADISPPKNSGYPYLRHSPVYELALRVHPQGTGTVSGAGVYRSTEQVSISATAQNDYVFIGWSQDGNIIHTSPNQTISLSANTTMTAVFSKQTTSIPSKPDPLSQIMIYPNPATNKLVVETSGSADILLSVAIINLLGQTLLYQPANDSDGTRVHMNISGLAPGTYLVMARFKHSYGVEKLIVR